MKTLIIFDRKTGEVLQTHLQTEDLPGDPQELLPLVRPEAKAESVGVLAVDPLTPGTRYRVDVKLQKLVSVDQSKAPGAGGASVQSLQGDPGSARTVIFPSRPKQP